MIKIKSSFLLLLIWSIVRWGGSILAQENSEYDFIINNFDTQIDVQENGDLFIQEQITTTFNEAKHGIYRSIPFRYEQSGELIKTDITNISVDNQNYTSYKEGDNMIIKIGDADITLSPGENITYNIGYHVRGGVRAYSGYQELYWNIIGNDRNIPIQKTHFKINLPVDFQRGADNRFAYFGAYGTRNILSTVEFLGKTIEGREDNGLNPHDSITVGLKFTENTFLLPKINKTLEGIFAYAFFLVPIGLFSYLYRLWKKYGKDDPVPDVVQYYAPDNLTPPELKAFLKRNINANDMVSLLYKRASQDLITIEKKEGGFLAGDSYILHKINEIEANKDTKDFEKILFNRIFSSGEIVNISERKDLYEALEQAADTVYAKYSYAPNYTPESKSAFWKMLLMIILIPIGITILLIIIIVAIIFLLSIKDPNIWNDVGFTIDSVLNSHIGYLILIFLSTLVMGIFFLSIIYAKTDEYEVLLSKIRGYKTFLEKVEKPKLQTLLREDPSFIDKALPYAVVLGIAGVLLKVANEVLEGGYHPTWLIGPHWGNTNNIIKDMQNIQNSEWTKPPAPSGGGSFGGSGGFSSGGGGFSGGGGGGGGGGSW